MKRPAESTEMERFPSVMLIQPYDKGASAFEKDVFLQGRICGEAAAESKIQQDSSQQNTSPRGVLDRPLHSLGTMTTEEGQGRSARFDERELENGRAQAQSFSMDDDHSSEEEDQTEDESCLRRSARNHGTDRLHSSPREKRKVGRPIIYSGDPDAPDLTPQERRRIRRRIANRESARRVRAKRQDLIEEMSIKAQEMQELNAKLMARAQEVEQKHNLMLEHVGQMNECLKQKTQENERLQSELEMLKNAMKEKVDLGAVKGSLANTNLHLVAFPAAQQQQPNQPPMPSTTVTSGAIGVLQSHVPPQQPSGSFQFLAFNTAAQAPPQMDALEMQLASMQGMPSYGSPLPLQLQPSGKDGLPPLGPAHQGSGNSSSIPLMQPNSSAQMLSKALSLEGVVGALSMDRSLSEFLHEVTCL